VVAFLSSPDRVAFANTALEALCIRRSRVLNSSLELPMKLASFNINNINRRLTNLLDWLPEAEPDVVCLQELKTTDAGFPAEALRQAGYHAVWRGEARWNGVAIVARWAPVLTRLGLPGSADDGQVPLHRGGC
jgi:Endonuclease/Exonuclease/phosphatase family